MTRPVANRCLEPAGSAFLITAPLLAILISQINGYDIRAADAAGDGFASAGYAYLSERLITAGLLLAAAYVLNKSIGRDWTDLRPPWPILAVLIIAAALFPVGGALALLVILTGYIIGNRPLAIIGVLLQIYYLYLFYFDLVMSLLHKSFLLMATGLVFLGVWYWISRRESEAGT